MHIIESRRRSVTSIFTLGRDIVQRIMVSTRLMPKTYARFDLRLVEFPWPRLGQEFALALIFEVVPYPMCQLSLFPPTPVSTMAGGKGMKLRK